MTGALRLYVFSATPLFFFPMSFTPLNQVQICNLALSRIGAQAITSITDTTNPSAIACNTWWTMIVSEVGRSAPWKCLMKRVMINPVTGYPPAAVGGVTPPYLYEWNAQYALPSDYLRMVMLNGNDVWASNGFIGDEFEVYGQALLNPSLSPPATPIFGPSLFGSPTPDPTTGLPPTADVKYTAYTDDTTTWDQLFVACVAALLSVRIATVIRKDDTQMAQAMEKEYLGVLLPRALKIDGNEAKPVRYCIDSESRFIGSRWCSTNG